MPISVEIERNLETDEYRVGRMPGGGYPAGEAVDMANEAARAPTGQAGKQAPGQAGPLPGVGVPNPGGAPGADKPHLQPVADLDEALRVARSILLGAQPRMPEAQTEQDAAAERFARLRGGA